MPDPRSVMKEFRYLDEKRSVEGLTPEEDARYAHLRDLVGPEGAGGVAPKAGFDVSAAAARLRDSLLPAGLRNRPPPPPEPAPAAAAETEVLGADWVEQPADAAQPYDPAGAIPGSEPFDPAAAVDPGAALAADAQAYDPAAGYGPDPALALDAQAYETDPAYDPGAAPTPDAPTLEAGGYDPAGQPAWDPSQAWDPNQGWDPNAYPVDAAAQPPALDPADPSALQDPGVQGGWDPDQPWDPGSVPLGAGVAFDGSAEPIAAAAPAVGDGSLLPAGWELGPPAPEPAAEGAPLGDYDGDGAGLPPLELGAPETLPFDVQAEPAPAPGEPPAGYGAPLGEYDDTAAFEGEPYAATDLSSQPAALEANVEPGQGAAWQPDAALDDGFQLASDGSFGAATAAGPEVRYEFAPAPEEDGLDPGFTPQEVPGELAAGDDPAGADAEVAFDLDVETVEIPTVEGADILEEIPEESAAPPPRPLDFEPLVPPPEAAVSPAAIAPPPPIPPPAAVPDAEAGPAAPAAPQEAARAFVVPGAQRVVIHTVEGQAKRGALQDADLAAETLALTTQPAGTTEAVPTEKVKAIFFMLAPGEKPLAPEGRKVRVTFRDGRQVAGFSPDYDETGAGFFMIPGDTRTNTGRIWVYRSAVRQVVVSW